MSIGENIHTGATVTRGKGYGADGKGNSSLERQGDAGWGVQRRTPTHELVQVGLHEWKEQPKEKTT